LGFVVALDGETGLGLGGGDEFDNGANVGQRPASPVDGDEAEEAMPDLWFYVEAPGGFVDQCSQVPLDTMCRRRQAARVDPAFQAISSQ
jgi:hypothetical protein